MPDLDVSTKALCVAAKRKWDEVAKRCPVFFPQDKPEYGPDVSDQGAIVGAYESISAYKSYPGGKIVTFDAPHTSGAADGSTYKGDFVFIVRGTNGKSCWIKFSISLTQKAGKDDESLKVTGSGVGSDSVPGVP